MRTWIPNTATIMNCLFGLSAILLATHNQLIAACYCVVFAAIMDSLDGRLARALSVSSPFGAMLDDHADAVSFGIAPCVILFQSLHLQPFYAFGIGSFYILSVIFRLCRCSLVGKKWVNAYPGLPSPLGAGFALLPYFAMNLLYTAPHPSLWLLSTFFITSSVLMVLPYPVRIYRNISSKIMYTMTAINITICAVIFGKAHCLDAFILFFFSSFFVAIIARGIHRYFHHKTIPPHHENQHDIAST